MWNRCKRHLRWCAWGAGVLLVMVAALMAWAELAIGACTSAVAGSVDTVPTQRVALILGTNKRLVSGQDNPYFVLRMQAAAALWRSGRVRALIVSGDNHRVEYDEATDMRDALIALGVPGQAIHRDYAGFRTLDSVVRAKAVFGQDQLVIVSQRFHCERAIFLARSHGIDAVGFAAADPDWITMRMWMRERAARMRCLLDVHVLGSQPRFLGHPEVI